MMCVLRTSERIKIYINKRGSNIPTQPSAFFFFFLLLLPLLLFDIAAMKQ
jgi:hypothetical protein